MKTKWKIATMFERRIEVDEKMVTTPFVKLVREDGAGDMYFTVPGATVVYLPEKVDLNDRNGTITLHKVIEANTVVDTITAPDGTVFKQDELIDLNIG